MLQVQRYIATDIKKTYFQHLFPALEEAKSVARIISSYFENDKLKNETKEQTTNMNTSYNLL